VPEVLVGSLDSLEDGGPIGDVEGQRQDGLAVRLDRAMGVLTQ
jgi:hypothetical protein